MPKTGKHKHAIDRTRAQLVEHFPLCFRGPGEEKTPLKVGIGEDVMQAVPELGYWRVFNALVDYTGGPTYLRGVVAGAQRLDLHGEPTGAVTESQERYAQNRLDGYGAKERKRVARRAEDLAAVELLSIAPTTLGLVDGMEVTGLPVTETYPEGRGVLRLFAEGLSSGQGYEERDPGAGIPGAEARAGE